MTFAIFYNADDMGVICRAVDSQRPHNALARSLWGGGLSDWQPRSHLATAEPSFTTAHALFHAATSQVEWVDAYVVVLTGGTRDDLRSVLADAGETGYAADVGGNRDPALEHCSQSAAFWPEIWTFNE